MFRTMTIATLLILAATTAQADNARQVAFGDLNLSRPEDAKILSDRLQVAAKMVCLDANNSPAGKVAMRGCVDAAITAATIQIEERIEQRMLSGVHANLVNIRQRVSDAGVIAH